jgi:hypothetical protein
MKTGVRRQESGVRTKLATLAMLAVTILAGCATLGLQAQAITPTKAFNEASQAYINAWESYHKVWAALPETDSRKKAWVKDYHPKFYKAAEYLELWGQNYADPTKPVGWDTIISACEDVLMQLMIKK